MKKLLSLATALLLMTVSALAPATDAVTCNEGGTQIELNACAADDLAVADKQLNEVYKALMTKEAKNKAFTTKLRTAQKAWVAFRDAELDAMYACNEGAIQICWGSMVSQTYATWQAKMTRERTKRLQQYLDEGQPADGSH